MTVVVSQQTTKCKVVDLQKPTRWALNGGPFGSKLGRRDYVPYGVPVIRGVNIAGDRKFNSEEFVFVSEEKADELRPNLAKPGDLIFTQRGTLGQVGIIPQDSHYDRYVISQSQMKLTVDDTKADTEFLYYYFRAPATVHGILNHAISSGVPHINLDMLRNFEVDLPDLPVQRQIAGILSAYDDLIENNTRRIKILEEMAQALYREWFVHFRYPGHEYVPLVDSPAGLIPEGWQVGRLDDAIVLQRGFDLPLRQREPGTVPVYAATGVVGVHNEAKVRGPGIVTGRSGSLGTVTYIEEDFWPLNTTLWVREFRNVSPLWTYYLLRSKNLGEYNSGAAVPTLNRNHIHGLRIVIPDVRVLQSFDTALAPVISLARLLTNRNQVLQQIRDYLLPYLMDGQGVHTSGLKDQLVPS